MSNETPTESKETKIVLPTGESVDYKEFTSNLMKELTEKMKEAGVGATEIQHGKLPVDLTEAEKKLSDAEQKQIKVGRFFKAIYRKDFNYLSATKAINTEGTGANGGYLTNPEFSAEVIRRIEKYGVLRNGATVYTMGSQKMILPVGNAKITGAFVNEGSAAGESNPTFLQKELSRKDYAVLSVISKQLLEDTSTDMTIMDLLAEYAAEDFSKAEDYQGFLGAGSPITGIVSATTTSANNFATDSSDFGASLTGDLLIDVAHSLTPSRSNNAAFYLHRTALAQVRKLKDSDGNYIWQSLADGTPGLLCGKPIVLVEAMNAYDRTAALAGTEGDKAYIVFGDLKNVVMGSRKDINVAMTTDATIGSNNLFEKGLVGFRFEQSFDIVVPRTDDFAIIKSGS